ncbi:MAG: ABC transporter ATP-binding protein [Actinomycetes bacterium]
MSDGSAVVRCREVRKTFDRGQVVALAGASLDVAPGEFVAITGPSGCGKSTLLHLLAAIDSPDSGEVCVLGRDLRDLGDPDRFRRTEVGLVFQMHHLLPHLDALANVGVAMFGTHVPRRDQRRRAAELLALVGLPGLGHRRPPELSGGERQRVAIARSLANRPSLLLADEPTGSLDEASTTAVVDLLEHVRTAEQVTVVTVTHDPLLLDAADRVVRMQRGRVESADSANAPAVQAISVAAPSN